MDNSLVFCRCVHWPIDATRSPFFYHILSTSWVFFSHVFFSLISCKGGGITFPWRAPLGTEDFLGPTASLLPGSECLPSAVLLGFPMPVLLDSWAHLRQRPLPKICQRPFYNCHEECKLAVFLCCGFLLYSRWVFFSFQYSLRKGPWLWSSST